MSNIITLYPVYKEITADIETPVSAYYALTDEDKNSGKTFLLESVEMGEKLGRYSFIGLRPSVEFISKGKMVTIINSAGKKDFESGNPIVELKTLIASYKSETVEGLPPFSSGFVGYVGYDSIRYFENIPDKNIDIMGTPDIHMMLPSVLIAFDHIKQKLILITYTTDKNNKEEAEKLLKEYEEKLYTSKPPIRLKESNVNEVNLKSNFRKEDSMSAVEKCKDYIVAGDIFQVVISQRLKTKINVTPFDVYRKLRMINPSPYMFYFDMESYNIIGSSPEVMVKVANNNGKKEVLVRPIAGTRRRGRNHKEDLAIEQELLADKKELAEHTMLLDLARNDVGRIAKYNTVRVEAPFHIERYSHVMHIVSDVYGVPDKEWDALDILGAAFPAGTVSGSPKVRAMEIIDELENEKRGIYAGAVGHIDLNGNMDTCIALRTMIYKDGEIFIQAGAGIVYDSVPEKEYEETINKAKALIKAII